MASSEIIKRAIASGRVYDDLPPRIKSIIPPYEWRIKVKEHCIQRGLPWASSLACTVVGQQEYYDDLLKSYKAWMRLFPYHLSDFLCRVARITPFKYYLDMLASMLKDERSYDRMPNFTAADALSVVGIGRNEYISALNACKARRLLWRVNLNRDSIVREQLPQEPTTNQRLEPWWRVAVVNIGEAEFRELGEEELAHLKTAALPSTAAGGDIRVRDFQLDVLRGLLRKGLAYVEVPVEPSDRFAIPPLEGFVSNKTTEAGDAAADPLEGLLYSVFVANSERMTVAELGAILGVEMGELQAAIGVASRLGFATRVTDSYSYSVSAAAAPTRGLDAGATAGPGAGSSRQIDLLDDSAASSVSQGVEGGGAGGGLAAGSGFTGASGGESGSGEEALRAEQRSLKLAEGLLGGPAQGGGRGAGAVAVLVDAEATGYLMMGALSPGLKRHSVTLFEGGRVAGEEVMREMVAELWASYAAGQRFEGEMLRLTHYAAALASLLEAVRASAGPGVALELLRKESLAGLSPLTACKVLNHAYCAVVPISPLPPPVLPLSPYQSGPAYYGPTLEAVSPWLHLALYSAARCGPQSFVFVCGQRVWRLPHPLDRCTHALLTPWDEDSEHHRARAHSSEGQAMLVEASFLLYTLNELLSRTAVLVQPLDCTEADWAPDVVDVPLPLPAEAVGLAVAPRSSLTDLAGLAAPVSVQGIRRCSGQATSVTLQPNLLHGLRQLGLATCVGHLRLIRLRTPHHPHNTPADGRAGPPHSGPHMTAHAHPAGQQPPPPAHLPRPGDTAAATPATGGVTHGDAAGARGAPAEPSLPAGGAVPAAPAAADTSLQSPRTPAAGAGTGSPAAADPGPPEWVAAGGCEPWLPLCVQLGVPLYSLDLCKAVCRAAEAAGFLRPEGRQLQLQSQQQLQNHLTKLLLQYSHASQDGTYGSWLGQPAAYGDLPSPYSPGWGAGTPASGGGGATPGFASSASVPGSAGGAVGGPQGPGWPGSVGGAPGGGTGAGNRHGPVLPLPALNLSFDGNSLQPIRVQDSVQGLGCLCQA